MSGTKTWEVIRRYRPTDRSLARGSERQRTWLKYSRRAKLLEGRWTPPPFMAIGFVNG